MYILFAALNEFMNFKDVLPGRPFYVFVFGGFMTCKTEIQ
uniref:Uncharacterized protein n=1 Tax=Siphoviridae sp. ctFH16 TaxID=2827817 RepID=A0A8S5TN95_9CAUD|nr:MAG TPA: hypothetical protein [Siphoviridae sp. ctFH16]